jgi:hypothetical protein
MLFGLICKALISIKQLLMALNQSIKSMNPQYLRDEHGESGKDPAVDVKVVSDGQKVGKELLQSGEPAWRTGTSTAVLAWQGCKHALGQSARKENK